MSFNGLPSLIAKNLKMFFRSKISSIAVILIPVLIVLFVGFAFDSSGLSNIQVGVYSEGYTSFTNSVISDFEEGGFTSNRYSSAQACIESIKHSESQICIIFPNNLNPDVSTEEIVFYVDYSRVNLANSLINEIQTSVLIKTSSVGEDIAQGLINSLENVKSILPNTKTKVDDALDDVEANKEAGSESSNENISEVIDELESIENDINDSGLKNDIGDVLEILEDIQEETSNDLEAISERQDNIISDLKFASSNLNSIIVSLNANRNINASDIVSPIETRIEAITIDSNNKDYMVPIILSLIALFGAILLSSTFVLKEKKSKAFFRNFMAPTKNITFILSTYLTCLIIISIQFTLIFIGAKYALRMSIMPILGPLLVILLLSLSTFVAIGMFIGYLFRSDETVIFSSMIVAALLMFFSNIILPLENISIGLIKFLKFNPLVVANLAFKKIILFNFGFAGILDEIVILTGFFIIFFSWACVLRKLTRRIL